MIAMPQGQTNREYTIDQDWAVYTESDHAIWRELFMRQSTLLPGRVCEEFLDGLHKLGVAAERIPKFEELSAILGRATGWSVVAVPGLIPDDIFFEHLANRRFPATNWIRRRDQMDYLQEPDIFHDVFGHVPLLMNPVTATTLHPWARHRLERGRGSGVNPR